MLIESLQVTGSFQVSGAANIPYGTTASRTAGTGSLFYSINDNSLQIDDGAYWVTLTSSYSSPPTPEADIEYLVVAGGGGGADSIGGGGGAGGFLSSSLSSIESGSSITITVGGGGTGGDDSYGTNGADSSIASSTGTPFTTVTSVGGGHGGYSTTVGNGGSGGGGSGLDGTYTGGSGTAGQGFDGGTGAGTFGGNDNRGGGGGGASEAGTGGKNITGNGGDGKQSSITGTATYYAGGGGGSKHPSAGSYGAGGQGGGGNGNVAGTANTGGGGGGSLTDGRAGGSGIVILAYPSSSISANGGIKSTRSDGHIVHTFNNSGTFTVGGPDDYIIPNQHFNILTWSGNGSSQTITGAGFQPDFMWIKQRNSSVASHRVIDTVRGGQRLLFTNSTSAEDGPNSTYPTTGSDGIHLPGADSNESSGTYVGWVWKAGGTAVSNTDGDITSQVSANQAAGFSIVKYTGNGNTAQQSYGHGLSQAPELVINKGIDTLTQGTNHWVVGGTILGDGGYMFLSLANSKNTASSYNGGQVPDSDVVYISGTSDLVHNENNKNFISYCFHSVDGYQKVGTYTGNGSSTGPEINTGFKPKFVMIKWTDDPNGNSSWGIWDTVREGDDNVDSPLRPNAATAESNESTRSLTFLTNGFQPAGTSGIFNDNGGNYIYLAIA